jgi:hypothetical protein
MSQNKKANLSFHNNRAFLKKVDQLPTGPDWTCKMVTAAGNRVDENDELMSEDLELWMRNPVECIKELISNPAFREHMAYAPERVYGAKDGREESRIFDEMWTAEWWWKLQVRIDCIQAREYESNRELGNVTSWRLYQRNNPVIRQNKIIAVLGRQNSVAGVSDDRKYI